MRQKRTTQMSLYQPQPVDHFLCRNPRSILKSLLTDWALDGNSRSEFPAVY